ncbi:DUF4267 domain-containing protein [Microbulbifer yueqingensis]|uniref:DUF4345 domain-containing protein n=1 Tax=Microbulbifer yueqingensis TaxID=658219 RepID=A0A1G8VW21_9GAMM|nr:DUF4267 domain-containing protein [Microbulbifer yueqingensis]SDJ69685.1 hypothetical protein SAMN05216212_0739 [Microbulbifer yueqingensis]
MKHSVTVYLTLNVAIFAAIGVMAFLDPAGFAGAIDFGLLAPPATPELLATFGGLMLAIALAISLPLVFRRYRAQGCLLVALAYLGFGCGRLWGMLVYSGFDWRNGLFLATEVVLVAWGLACFWQTRRDASGAPGVPGEGDSAD